MLRQKVAQLNHTDTSVSVFCLKPRSYAKKALRKLVIFCGKPLSYAVIVIIGKPQTHCRTEIMVF